jgi:V/A-type H+-transporting ATPase subunit D
MLKVKFTKGELKRQRDALKQFQRYLPTLQLKKQQLQIEILHQTSILGEKEHQRSKKTESIKEWTGLLADPAIDMRPWITPKEVVITSRNIAGVDLPVFARAEFDCAEYDLFVTPLWVDRAIEELRNLVSMRKEIDVIEKGIMILRHELRITTQRVNLFEKVKIPEAQEVIRLIKIYLGDQMSNAVGRSKIAKKKIEAVFFACPQAEEAAV